QHQAVGQVVDVLGGAGEVHELADRFQLVVHFQLFLDVVLDCLDVVVGGALDFLDAHRTVQREALRHVAQDPGGVGTRQRHFGNTLVARQRFQPVHFHADTVADQAIFAGDLAQLVAFAGVAAVNRGNGGESVQFAGHDGSTGMGKSGAIIPEYAAGV